MGSADVADVAGAAVLLAESFVGDACSGDELHLLEYFGPGDHGVRGVVRAELFTLETRRAPRSSAVPASWMILVSRVHQDERAKLKCRHGGRRAVCVGSLP